MSDDYKQRSRNFNLVKDDVGKAKPTCYDLPPEHHAYGRSEQPDMEGAREVTMHWAAHVPRPRPMENAQDIRKINKMATKDGVGNAKDLAAYRKTKDVKLIPTGPAGSMPKVIPSDVIPSFAYGRKSRPSTPIASVVGNHYAAEYEEALSASYENYLAASDMPNGKHRIKLTKGTNVRIHNARVARATEGEPVRPLFKMTKFSKVPSRVGLVPLGGGIAKSASAPALVPARGGGEYMAEE